MADHFPMLVPGATSDDGNLEVVAPFDGSVIATVTAADGAAIDQGPMQTPPVFLTAETNGSSPVSGLTFCLKPPPL